MYRWDFDGLARQQFASLSPAGQGELTAFMNAVILVDPMEYQQSTAVIALAPHIPPWASFRG